MITVLIFSSIPDTLAAVENLPPEQSGSFSLATGQRVGARRFVLKKVLGQGGMGMVWLGQDEQLHEPVALKFLPPQIRFDPAAISMMRKETSRSRKLSHPNIVRIHDFHQHDGEDPFIAMEFVDGQTLHALRFQQPNELFAWDKLAPWVRQLCDALDYAHGEKIIHRDLKPSNLMLDNSGRLKLADFGIAAQVSDSVTRLTGTTGGTPVYMSPQQVDGKAPQPADDIYSLGATLYELLTGTPPFYTGQIVHQVLHNPPTTLRERLIETGAHNEIPPDVEAMIMASLAKEPERRPQSARAVADWIGLQPTPHPRSLEATVIPAGQNHAEEVEAAKSQRKMLPAVGVFLLLALVGLGGFWAWKEQQQAKIASQQLLPAATPPVPDTKPVHTRSVERVLLTENFEGFSRGTKFREQYRQGEIVSENGSRFLRMRGDNVLSNYFFLEVVPLPPDWEQVTVSVRLRAKNIRLNPHNPLSGVRVVADFLGINPATGKEGVYWGSLSDLKGDSDWVQQQQTFLRTALPAWVTSLHTGPNLRTASGTADFDDFKVAVVEESKR